MKRSDDDGSVRGLTGEKRMEDVLERVLDKSIDAGGIRISYNFTVRELDESKAKGMISPNEPVQEPESEFSAKMKTGVADLQARFGDCPGFRAVVEYLNAMPPGDYALSRLKYFASAQDAAGLMDLCLREIAMQEILLKRIKGIVSFFPRKYLQSPRYRLIRAEVEKEYQRLLEASPDVRERLSALHEEEPSAPATP